MNFEAMSVAELTAIYNKRVPLDKQIKKFSTKSDGVRRVQQLLDQEKPLTVSQCVAKALAEEVFSRELKNLSLSAHKWLPGAFADFHSDNTEMDGTPNARRENKLVTIIYLNDDYEGGHLVFRDHPIDIAPKAGTVVVFDVGYENIHGVTEILSGQRWTMLASFDYADSVYPPEYWEEKNRELAQTAEVHKEQRAGWEQGKIDRLIDL